MLLDAVLNVDFTVETVEERLPVLESVFLFTLFKERVVLLSDERLSKLSTEEEGVVSSVLDATEDCKEDLEGRVDLGRVFLEPPIVGSFVPLPATIKQLAVKYTVYWKE